MKWLAASIIINGGLMAIEMVSLAMVDDVRVERILRRAIMSQFVVLIAQIATLGVWQILSSEDA